MTQKKRDELFREIAKELRKKHELMLYQECLEIAHKIYEMTNEE